LFERLSLYSYSLSYTTQLDNRALTGIYLYTTSNFDLFCS